MTAEMMLGIVLAGAAAAAVLGLVMRARAMIQRPLATGGYVDEGWPPITPEQLRRMAREYRTGARPLVLAAPMNARLWRVDLLAALGALMRGEHSAEPEDVEAAIVLLTRCLDLTAHDLAALAAGRQP